MGRAEEIFLDELMDAIDRRCLGVPHVRLAVEGDRIVAYVDDVQTSGVGPYGPGEARPILDMLVFEIGTRIQEWDRERCAGSDLVADELESADSDEVERLASI